MADLGDAPPSYGPKFSQFHAVIRKFGKIICWRPPPVGLAPPPTGNPGSAPAVLYPFLCSFWQKCCQSNRLAYLLWGWPPSMENRGSVTAIGNDFNEQECIPVGCVPSAAVAVSWGGVCPGGCLSRRVCPGRCAQGDACPGVGVCLSAQGVCVCVSARGLRTVTKPQKVPSVISCNP